MPDGKVEAALEEGVGVKEGNVVKVVGTGIEEAAAASCAKEIVLWDCVGLALFGFV